MKNYSNINQEEEANNHHLFHQFFMNKQLLNAAKAAQSIANTNVSDFREFLIQVDDEDFDPDLMRRQIYFYGVKKQYPGSEEWKRCTKRCKVALENEDFELSPMFRGVAQEEVRNNQINAWFLDVVYCYWLSKLVHFSLTAESLNSKGRPVLKFEMEGSNDSSSYQVVWRQKNCLLIADILGWRASSRRSGKPTGNQRMEGPSLSLSKKHDVSFGNAPKASVRTFVEETLSSQKSTLDKSLLPRNGLKILEAIRTGPSL